MKNIFIIIIIIIIIIITFLFTICQAKNVICEELQVINLTTYFYPVICIDIFDPFNREYYKDKKLTFILKGKYPITYSVLLGIRLRISVDIVN